MTSPPLETARAVLQGVLSCPVRLGTDPSQMFREFEADACLSPQLQPAFTASFLDHLYRESEPQVVHELLEPLGMAAAMIRWDESLLLIGPYTHDPLHPGVAEEILGRHGIPSLHLQPYKLHRTRFPIIDTEYIHRSAVALLHCAGKEDAFGSVRPVHAEAGSLAPGLGELPQSASFEVIDERYAHELEFMDAVADGATDRALSALQRLAGMPQVQSYMTTPFLGATILRIMARVAAQRGGLPPVTIDAISQEYAQRLHRSGHSADSRRTVGFTAKMVADFCHHVRRHRQRHYSPLVRRATDEIELHLSHQVTTPELAARFGVSASTLSRRFKAETGNTVAAYVAAQRTERAARMLSTTRESVQDIALFVGYEDANYFVKVFRAAYGMTPSAYRTEHGRLGALKGPAAG